MAEKEKKVNPGGVGENPQAPESVTADSAGKGTADKGDTGLKTTDTTLTQGNPNAAAINADQPKNPPEAENLTDKTAATEQGQESGLQQIMTSLREIGGSILKADPKKQEGIDAFNSAVKSINALNEQVPADRKELKALLLYAADCQDLNTLKKQIGTVLRDLKIRVEKEQQQDAPQKEKPEKPSKADNGEKPKKPRAARMQGETNRGKGGAVDGEKPPQVTEPTPPTLTVPPNSNEERKIVWLTHDEVFPFKDHPFDVRMDDDMQKLVESIKERGVDQATLVRPREGGGYEMVAGHRRQMATKLAGYSKFPAEVRKMTDEEAVLAMAETNFTTREKILPSERAKALQMQLNAIKQQGARFKNVAQGDIGKRSVEIIADRNKMNYKTVQRYIALNNLVPELMKLTDEGKLKFIPAFEMSYIGKKNQQYIASLIESEERAPTLAQIQRMRDLDQKKQLTPAVIDGIMVEENKKEERKVVFNSPELDKYFSADKTPAEMKAVILKAMDEYKEKQPLEFGKTEKPKDKEL